MNETEMIGDGVIRYPRVSFESIGHMEIIPDWGREHLKVILSDLEVELMKQVLSVVARDYGIQPQELDPKLREVWYASNGFQSGEFSEDDEEIWMHSLKEFRGENGRRIQRWLEFLVSDSDPVHWEISFYDVEMFLIAINDYRLSLGAKYDVQEQDMAEDWDVLKNRLESSTKCIAIDQIHFLGWFMECVMEAMRGSEEGNISAD
jgi:hypothetical protein